MNKHPISISHLVFGLIFLGITAMWVVGATTGVEAPALALWGPVVLIAAGVVGLAAIVLNSRSAAVPPSDGTSAETSTETTTETQYAGTADVEEQP